MRLPPALVVALLLAGCIGSPADEAPGATAIAPATIDAATSVLLSPNATVDTPVWAVGDAWLVETHDDDEHAQSTLVVSAVGSDAYTLSTTSEWYATFDATFDMSYIGRIRADDLSGSQRDVPVKFFDFPLAHGKTWETAWDRTTVALTATFSPAIPTPLGPQPGFLIEGTRNGEPYVRYDYVPALRWWSKLDFAAGYGLTVKGVASNWSGEYAIAVAKPLLTLEAVAPVTSTPAGTFTVDEGQTSVLLTLVGHAGPFARGLVLLDPANAPFATKSPTYEANAEPTRFFLTETLPPTPGAWHVLAPALHAPEGWLTLTVTQVAIEKRAM